MEIEKANSQKINDISLFYRSLGKNFDNRRVYKGVDKD